MSAVQLPARRSGIQLILGVGSLLLLLSAFHYSGTVDTAWLQGFHDGLFTGSEPRPQNAPFAKPISFEHSARHPLRPDMTSKTSFRPNLIPGERYITAQSYLGFNNQFQSIMHLLYLALKTERVAIIPPLQPIHVKPASFAPWSEFFDLDAVQRETGVALLEWTDLKDSILNQTGALSEEIACWSSREASAAKKGRYQLGEDMTFDYMGLQRVMWPLPGHIRGTRSGYAPLVELIAFDADASYKQDWVRDVEAGDVKDRVIPPIGSLQPDEQLLCFDDTFYLMQSTHDLSPSYPHDFIGPQQIYGSMGIADADMVGWRTIGQYMRWNKAVSDEVDRLLRFTLGLSKRARIPAYLGAHIRHGDFSIHQTIEAFAEKIESIRLQLDQQKPFQGKALDMPVICSTDESDPEFLAQIAMRGWHLIDHAAFKTIQRHGIVGSERYSGWWPTILSSAILGNSQGFVGTHWSTFSIYSWIRVLTWREGGIGTEA